MGIYLNPGNENFKEATNADIYVDKTEMIRVINRFIDTGNKYVCVSRPRRFGKTTASNMLNAYYSRGCDSRELFSAYKIADDPDFTGKLNRYNVIKIDMNSEYQNAFDKEMLVQRLTEKIKREMTAFFPTIPFEADDSLAECILKVYAETKETFVILLDEYDVLVREQVDERLFNEYLAFLNGMFKSDTVRPAISLAYITGILPVVRDKVQSKLNNFREYTILDGGPIAEFTGFIGEEVETLCRRYGTDYQECKLWYDGYRQNSFDIYNPESVVRSLEMGRFGSYWGQTSSYEAISDQISMNFAGTKDDVVRMLAGEEVYVDVSSYLNTMTDFSSKDDTFCFLMHLGYLAYDRDTGCCRIPNKEVREEWFRALKKIPDEYAITTEIIQQSKELLNSTIEGNEEAAARALDVSHIHVTSNRSYNNEDALQSAIYLSYIYALNRYTVVREMTSGKGFADVVYIPIRKEDPALIIELKRNNSACSALEQIKDKKYFDSLAHYQGKLVFVGINYNEKSKTHTCKIEKFQKYESQTAMQKKAMIALNNTHVKAAKEGFLSDDEIENLIDEAR